MKRKSTYEPSEAKDILVAEASMSDTKAITTVSKSILTSWYRQGGAVASLLQSGAFAHVEGKVCLFDAKYIERSDDGKLRLTPYALAHEEECFLQFLMDEHGELLHYVRMPESKANKDFHYYDHITPDILKKFGLVSEIVTEMLEQIHGMEFGDAMAELMSKRVCGYSNKLLRDNTGLDTNTISQMRHGGNLTILNVVSACLGLHIPLPVSKSMLSLANLSIDPTKPPLSNAVYEQLLAIYWAWDYEDTYQTLINDGHGQETLIKTPPGFKKAKK